MGAAASTTERLQCVECGLIFPEGNYVRVPGYGVQTVEVAVQRSDGKWRCASPEINLLSDQTISDCELRKREQAERREAAKKAEAERAAVRKAAEEKAAAEREVAMKAAAEKAKVEAERKRVAAVKAVNEKKAAEVAAKTVALRAEIRAPMETLNLENIEALESAVAWCIQNEAVNLAEVVSEGLLDELLASLSMKPLPKSRLKKAILQAYDPVPATGCDGFCSYKQSDGTNDIALKLFYEFKERRQDLWLDKMRGAERSEAGMLQGVQACTFFVALISPAYFSSAWCLLELREAVKEKKLIIVCFNGSKYKVQEALSWITSEFAHLTKSELVKLDEDAEYFNVGMEKIEKRLISV